MKVEDVAAIAHEANRAYCIQLGDTSQPIWHCAPAWQRKSAIEGVRFHLANPDATPEQSHENWMAEKIRDGWEWGPRKDPAARTHPCLVPYDQLPEVQRAKDHLFAAVVRALAPFVTDA